VTILFHIIVQRIFTEYCKVREFV